MKFDFQRPIGFKISESDYFFAKKYFKYIVKLSFKKLLILDCLKS